MQTILSHLERLYHISHVPMTLLDAEGNILSNWPASFPDGVHPYAYSVILEDFRLQKRDEDHPLVSFLGCGFLLGVMQLSEERFLLIGLVSPLMQSRQEILTMISNVVQPHALQTICDFLLQMPLMALPQLKDYMCLVAKLLLQKDLSADQILFVDITLGNGIAVTPLEKNLFEQREEPEFHIPLDFETGICNAIETGNRTLLERCLYAPYRGRIGRMSSSELRQQKYSFICVATLSSRAAIRGGIDAETAFSLSDLYCQRVDLLSDLTHIQNMTFTMLTDYCDRVRDAQMRPVVSALIERCLSYISVHLHETITLEQLADHCGLCSRSLSLRFRKEVGVGIPEYIHREKMKEAEYLLRHSHYSISEITSFLNYPSQSYFTQIFKSYRGMTPLQFRNRHSKEPSV